MGRKREVSVIVPSGRNRWVRWRSAPVRRLSVPSLMETRRPPGLRLNRPEFCGGL
jgi:hypothetical protein